MYGSTKKAEMLVNALRKTLSDFCHDRSLKRLSFNEEQIHKFDKLVLCCLSACHSLHFYHASICEGGLGSRNSVCLKVCLSICLSVTCMDCDKSK